MLRVFLKFGYDRIKLNFLQGFQMHIRPKIAIIGAGASGLMAAITAMGGASVTIFEQNSTPAKKLLATGNGRCNITNKNIRASDYISACRDDSFQGGRQGNKEKSIKNHEEYNIDSCQQGVLNTKTKSYINYGESSFALDILEQFGFDDFMEFCRIIALPLSIKNDGRCYPLTNEAKSVQMALVDTAMAGGVEILCDTKIVSLEYKNKKWNLISQSKEYFKKYDFVILATGSNAAPQLGGGEAGYAIARSRGHIIEPLFPALVQLHLDSPLAQKLAGVKCDGIAKVFVNGKLSDCASGDLLFTSYGISGFAILDVSNSASIALMAGQKVEIELDVIPNISPDELINMAVSTMSSMPSRTLLSLLGSIISPKIANAILKNREIKPEIYLKNCDTKLLLSIFKELKAWRFRIVDTHGFKHAEVSGGGVSLHEIDSKTMESKLVNGLYIVGEILDVTGKRGGYNLAFAWASGVVAARACLDRFLENK